VLHRRLRRIARDRRAYRAAARQAFVQRQFAYETGANGDAPGIAEHVSRVGGGASPGTLQETASEITRAAVRDYPDREAQLKAGIKTPRSLWYALALDPPLAPPTERELREVKARALTRRDEHDRYVAALVVGMDSDAVLAAELEVAIRRYLAADAWQIWQEVVKQAAERTHAAIERRRSRVRWLAERFGCGEHGGWSIADIARLLLASANDWTRPPCPLLAEKYGAQHDAGDAAGEEKLIEVLRKDLACAKPKKAPSRALGRISGKKRR